MRRAASTRSLQSAPAEAEIEEVAVVHQLSKESVQIKENIEELIIEKTSENVEWLEDETSNAIHEEDQHAIVGREFATSSIHPNPLLLVETIEEEDEDTVSEYENATVDLPSPQITIVCDEPSETSSMTSIDPSPRVSLTVPNANLTAPLVRQRTIDAMKPRKIDESEFSFIDDDDMSHDSDEDPVKTTDTTSPLIIPESKPTTLLETNIDDFIPNPSKIKEECIEECIAWQ